MNYVDVAPLWGDKRPSSVIKVERGEKRETMIQHMQGDKQCRIWTNESWWVNRICEWARKRPMEVEFEEFGEQGVTVLMPLSWMRTMRPKRVREVSEEEKERMRERAKLAQRVRMEKLEQERAQKQANDE